MSNWSKYCLALCCIIQLDISVFAQDSIVSYTGSTFTAKYGMKNGMLYGDYVSYYKNGKKKAVGQFSCNNRVNYWTVYDSLGKMKMERFYRNNFEYTRTFPTYPFGPAKLLSSPIYTPNRDSVGCYQWFYIQERAVTWGTRVFENVYLKNNPLIDSGQLFKMICKGLAEHKVKAFKYDSFNPDKSFLDSVSAGDIAKDTVNVNVIGYLIKEDWCYDIDRNISECRILGISPILEEGIDSVQRKEDKAGVKRDHFYNNLFWIYYPQLRPYLAKVRVNTPKDAPYIKNLDDVFFTRCYYGEIISSLGMNGIETVKHNRERLMEILDMEHNTWLESNAQ